MTNGLSHYPLIIVTGAAGWLGRRVVAALVPGLPEIGAIGSGGHRVRVLVTPTEPTRDLRAWGCEVVTGDIRDLDARKALMKGAEGALVIHLAGVIHPTGGTKVFEEVNHRGTLALVAAGRQAKVRRFVVMSSNSPMGANRRTTEMFTEDSPYNPYMGYGRSKFHMETGLKMLVGQPGAPEIVIARAPWFYGPGQPARQTLFFTMVRSGKFPLLGNGAQRRSMGYVDTLAQGLLLCGAAPRAAGRIYWLADDRPYPMSEIVSTVKMALAEDFGMAVNPKNLRLPSAAADMARIVDRSLQAVGLYHQKFHVLSEMNLTIACDVSRAKEELGFRPLVELHEGMRRSIAWCLENGHII